MGYGLRVVSISQIADTVGKYEKFEVDLVLDKGSIDPWEIEVFGNFTTPSGKNLQIEGFLYEESEGRGLWKVRFAPSEVGDYKYYIIVRGPESDELVSDTRSFKSKPSDNPGYIRVNPKDKLHFQFDNGDPFFAIGINYDPWDLSLLDEYPPDEVFQKMKQNGMNYARMRIPGIASTAPYALERKNLPLGHYDLTNARRFDQAIEYASKNGIYIMITFLTSQLFNQEWGWWDANPYNKVNGGPCEAPIDFFTNPTAKEKFRRLLRYIVARWGRSTNVFAWQLWNEVGLVTSYDTEIVTAWHKEMSEYLHSIDPYDHLVTTSYTNIRLFGGDLAVLRLPGIDFAQTHIYIGGWVDLPLNWGSVGSLLDTAGVAWTLGRVNVGLLDKPYFIGEGWFKKFRPERYNIDPEGVHLHNLLWGSVMAAPAGSFALWWHQYIHDCDLYYHYKALAGFLEEAEWRMEGSRSCSTVVFYGNKSALRVMGLKKNGRAIFWFQNPEHVWYRVGRLPIVAVPEQTIDLEIGFPDGIYEIRWWDTYNGQVTEITEATCNEGKLRLQIPTIEKDVACIITRKVA